MTDNKAKVLKVKLDVDLSSLTERDRGAIFHLQNAVRIMDWIYSRQMGYGMLMPRDGSVFMSGNTFYPTNLPKKELEDFIKNNSDRKDALESPFTIIRRDVEDTLTTVTYAELYSSELDKAAHEMRLASGFIDNIEFKSFLLSRADDFLSNIYFDGDVHWLKVGVDSPFELTIGPYEEYEDKLLGIRRTFEAFLGIVVPEETKKLNRYAELVRRFDAELAKKYGYQSVKTSNNMLVMDELLTGGEERYCQFTVSAYSLPNDEDFRRDHGSKQVFIRNVIVAKLKYVLLPIAERLCERDVVLNYDSEFLALVGHELAHGLGITYQTRVARTCFSARRM